MKIEHYDCVCSSADHSIRFVYFEDDVEEPDEIYIEVQLAHTNKWYQRVWKALKYIFGYECRFGHWDTWSLDPKDVDRLIAMLEAHRTRLKRLHHIPATANIVIDVNKENKPPIKKNPF